MRATVRKWGNSAAVRIPASVLDAASLSLDAEIDIRHEDGRIIIEAAQPSVDLSDLLAAITPDNLHAEVPTGEPVGRESL